MAKDLERFLQQAAERLANKINQDPHPRPQPQPPRNVRQAERARPEPEILEAEIVDADLQGPDPLSDLDTRHMASPFSNRPEFAGTIDQADERMAEHVKHVIDQDLLHLRDASGALQGKRESTQDDGESSTARTLVKMLRSPDTIRASFIASEIFSRKYD